MVSLFLRSPIWDFHLVKSRLRTGVPLSLESDAPKSSLVASPPFHTTTFSSVRYMQCTCAQYILSRAGGGGGENERGTRRVGGGGGGSEMGSGDDESEGGLVEERLPVLVGFFRGDYSELTDSEESD